MKKPLYMLLLLACSLSCRGGDGILVQAEGFASKGGWALDCQFYDQVGSAYLLAHGLGTPVEDASTVVKVPKTAVYHFWARTYNWNSPWDPDMAPGRFCLKVNGEQVGGELGAATREWGWEHAGSAELEKGQVTLSLSDLTGFDGRCDAIYITTSEDPVFPDTGAGSLPLVKEKNRYDLIVVGAGTAGISAAVAASRLGLKVLLLDEKDVFGGVSSPDVSITVSGARGGRYPALGRVISELGIPNRNYAKFESRLRDENVDLRLRHRVVSVRKKGARITGVTAVDFEAMRRVEFVAPLFADCTGDANLGFYAGARYMVGQEARSVFGESLAPEVPDGRSYGSSVMWKSVDKGVESNFPECPWAVRFDGKTRLKVFRSRWNWEVGFDKDQMKDAEWMRDYMFRVIYGNWDYLKNSPETSAEYATYALSWVSPVLGKRESRRLVGDYVITQNDIYQDGHYDCEGPWTQLPDACVWATYPIDQHFPDPENSKSFAGEEFLSTMQHNDTPRGISRKFLEAGVTVNLPYMIPYRCLYSADIYNMFMAGRDISGSRLAMCSYRVQGTTAQMGEVVGIAAGICKKKKCTPRQVYTLYLDELKAALEAGVPSKGKEFFFPN